MANTPIAHVPGSSQAAGTKQPQHVMLVDTNGDIVSVGGGTQYTEDAAAAADPVGNAVNLIRADTPATVTSANGDNIAQRGTNYGAAYTQIVTSAGAFVDSFGGGVQYTEGDTDATISGTALLWEDAADTLRAVSTAKPLPVVQTGTHNIGTVTTVSAVTAISNALPAGTNNIGDVDVASLPGGVSDLDSGAGTDDHAVVAIGVAAAGGHVAITGDATNGLDVDVTRLPALVAGTANIGDVDVLTVPAPLSTTGGGTEATALRVTVASDSTGVLSVDDNGGSLTVDSPDLAIVGGWDNAASDGASVSGDTAHDAVDAGEPVKVGVRAIAFGVNPTAVAAADRTNWYGTRHGIPFVLGGHMNAKSATYLWTAATTDDNIMAAIASGTKYAVTRLTFTLDEATTVGVAARVGFGTATVPALPAANADAVDDILFYHPGMVPGTMHTVGDGTSVLGVGGDGAELRITAEATTGGTGVVTVTYFTIES